MSCQLHVKEDNGCCFCVGEPTRMDILYGRTPVRPEYGERLTRTWYGYCMEWFSNFKDKEPATGKIRYWDPLHCWERS